MVELKMALPKWNNNINMQLSMKQFTRLYNFLPLLAMLCLASCASDELNDGLLPEGKYPMSFTTAVEGQVPTRTTTDNTWSGDEQVALAIDDEVKQYTPDNTGSSASLTSTNPFYWQTANETKIVRAWYCGAEYNAAQPTKLTVQTDQSGDGYKQSDFLYAVPQEIAFKDRNKAKLTFKHLPAKVVIHLTNGNGLTAEDVKTATVCLVNQATTSGEIDENNGIVAQTTPGNAEITSNVLAASVENYQKSVQALVVPQQMRGKKFIKVTIGKDAAARDYYYTPKVEGDANLECGMQYTYNITVTKGEELVVTNQTTVTWNEGTAQSGTVAPATSFNVTCPSGNGVDDLNISNAIALSGDKYTVNPNQSITISYKTTFKRSRYNLVQGIAKVSTSTNAADGTITLTVSEIRGDLVFSFGKYEYAEVGDYYYADGTWSPDYTSGNGSPACIGIVFKVGAGTGDHANYYGNKLPKGIRGYVVALNDAFESKCAWGGDNVLIETSYDQNDYLGYYNSRKIVAKANEGGHLKPDDAVNDYPAMYYISTYGNSFQTPSNSSGWYFPSTGQLSDIYQASSSIEGNVSTAKGTWFKSDDYLSSSEYNRGFRQYNVGSFTFKDGIKGWKEKDTDRAYVRAILTF